MITPLFRGATKPAMIAGIPLNALVAVSLPSILLVLLTWGALGFLALAFLLPAIIALPLMREMTKQDDQYLNMWLLELKERQVWLRKNKHGSVYVVPPKSLRDKKFIQE